MKKFITQMANQKNVQKGLQQLDKLADYLEKGEISYKQEQPGQQQSIPFMITKQMKIDLMELGYPYDDIKQMTPAYAQDLLQNKIKNSKK